VAQTVSKLWQPSEVEFCIQYYYERLGEGIKKQQIVKELAECLGRSQGSVLGCLYRNGVYGKYHERLAARRRRHRRERAQKLRLVSSQPQAKTEPAPAPMPNPLREVIEILLAHGVTVSVELDPSGTPVSVKAVPAGK